MIWVKRGAITTVTFLAIVATLVALRWLPVDAGQPPREIVLVVRDMSFYIDGQFERANPPLQLRAGERVQIVLRNEEVGMRHNFAVPAWNLATAELNGEGSTTFEFVVPDASGRQEYVCAPHSALMRGTIEIR